LAIGLQSVAGGLSLLCSRSMVDPGLLFVGKLTKLSTIGQRTSPTERSIPTGQ